MASSCSIRSCANVAAVIDSRLMAFDLMVVTVLAVKPTAMTATMVMAASTSMRLKPLWLAIAARREPFVNLMPHTRSEFCTCRTHSTGGDSVS